MDLRLAGKRALVTGSSSGIGAEIARMLSREGVRVVVHGRSAERAQAVAAEIAAAGGQVATVIGDLTDDAELRHVTAAAEAAFDGVDILINNAGVVVVEPTHGWFDTPIEEWTDAYRQNTLPAVRLAHAFAPRMKDRGWGRLIQLSARDALLPNAEFGPHGAAKSAINNLTVSLSRELAGSGVTSNAVIPGLVWTPMAAPWFKLLAQQQGSEDPRVGEEYAVKHVMRASVPRAGRPEDVAAAVCFLASPLADYITGTALRVDGGATPMI